MSVTESSAALADRCEASALVLAASAALDAALDVSFPVLRSINAAKIVATTAATATNKVASSIPDAPSPDCPGTSTDTPVPEVLPAVGVGVGMATLITQ